MRIKNLATFTFIAAAALLMVVAGCEGPEGPQGPAGQQGPEGPEGPAGTSYIYIDGYVCSPTQWDTTCDADVFVGNNPSFPVVEINDVNLSSGAGDPNWFNHSDFPISTGDSAELVVTYTKTDGNPGTARANIILPGPFEITSHDTLYDTISVGDSLAVCWTSSDGADAYSVYFDMYYEYIDTSGDYRYFGFHYDTLFTDTCIVFSQAELFPNAGEIDSIWYGYGNFHARAINGPVQEGDQGNVTGDGIGFFYGRTYGDELRIRFRDSGPFVSELQEPPNLIRKFVEEKARALNLY